ncbi:nucleoside hydrolase [Pseudomonas lundensis]|uniref:nucleoside hydrolase n=1 Tax=Serratia proteamaculans TaxID=28151 RepID=UPI002980D927|nr:nucleoside hydrolase [Serratia proteamaculans]MDW5498461.1 nucleoside hydrolase [Serratia proteamaculans]MDW5503521.1 nucleoside hydrolase [Pseudomonas lundensis]
MKRKVIFDTDPGIDDTMAMLWAHASSQIELVGITTVFGNATIENATRNALYIKQRFGLTADVAVGADTPLVVAAGEPTTFVHGDNGLGDIEIPAGDYQGIDKRAAHDYIIDSLKAHPGEITLIAVGRLTNLALAVEKDPSIASLVKEVIIMGGAFGYNGHTGNVTPFAEANIIGDPHAADRVMTTDWPVTVVGLDVTHQTVMTSDYIDRLRMNSASYGEFIYQITRFYADFHKKVAGMDGFYVHDSSAIAYAIAPELFKVKEGAVRVITEGPAMGHTLLKEGDKRYPIDEWSGKPKQRVCVEVDDKGLLELYMATMTQRAAL